MGIKNCPSCGYTGNWSFANICQRCGHKLRLVFTARALAWLMALVVCAGLGAAFYGHIRATASQESFSTSLISAGIKLEGWWEDISRPGSSFDALSLAPEKTESVDAKQLAEVPAEPAPAAAAPPAEPAPPLVQSPKPASKPAAAMPAAKPEPAQPAVLRQKSVFKRAAEFFSAAFASKSASPAAQPGANPVVQEKKPVLQAAVEPKSVPLAAKPSLPALPIVAKSEPAKASAQRKKSILQLAVEFVSAPLASKPSRPAVEIVAKSEPAKSAVQDKKPAAPAVSAETAPQLVKNEPARPPVQSAMPVVQSAAKPEPMAPKPQPPAPPRPAASSRVGMAFISAGSFTIGSPVSEGGEGDERPQTAITLDAYYIDATETTISDYAKCVAAGYCKEPRKGPGCNWGRQLDNNPANCISWPQAAAFCQWKGKRLPTEAEWENAARAGSSAAYYYGEDKKQLGVYAWYDRNSDDITHPVAARKPNAYGLYDMSGNVWEWVSDWYASGYAGIAKSNPRGPASGQDKVLRGGSSVQDEMAARSANRFKAPPSGADKMFGFRCAAPAN